MTTLALLLLAVGVGDVFRPADRRAVPRQLVRSLLAALVVAALAGWAVGAPAPNIVVAWVAAIGWILLTQFRRTWPLSLAWAPVAGVTSVVMGGSVNPGSPLADFWPTIQLSSIAAVDLDQLAVGVGMAVALINAANIAVRIATSFLPGPHDDRVDKPAQVATIKGGRFLGPLERLAIFGLVLTGNLGGVAVVVAAKSVIRFPEISASTQRAYDAEYYLVGSGLSWLLAICGAAITLIQ